MKHLASVLVVNCLLYTANALDSSVGKSLLQQIDDIPDSPRGSLQQSIERQIALLTPNAVLPQNYEQILPVTGATTFLALIGGLIIGSATKSASFTNNFFRRRSASNQRRQSVQRRQGKIEGFTQSLYNLAETFQKYNVNEPGCQLYVACEASKVQFRRKNGHLAKSVHHILSTIMRPENAKLYSDDLYMKDLVSAFKVGTLGANCAKFRRQCPRPKLG